VLAKAKEGFIRKRDREVREKQEAASKLQEIVRRQKLEKECINTLQRVYRGHLGRKAAKRWRMKRFELDAINALFNAASTCIQRIYRGHLGKRRSKDKRAEMAYFIALMRAQEAEQDEEEYWEMHQFQRYKRNARELVNNTLRADRALQSKPTFGGMSESKVFDGDGDEDD
jgi:hypothetical protein